jgi:hypothetical protein
MDARVVLGGARVVLGWCVRGARMVLVGSPCEARNHVRDDGLNGLPEGWQ